MITPHEFQGASPSMNGKHLAATFGTDYTSGALHFGG